MFSTTFRAYALRSLLLALLTLSLVLSGSTIGSFTSCIVFTAHDDYVLLFYKECLLIVLTLLPSLIFQLYAPGVLAQALQQHGRLNDCEALLVKCRRMI